MLKPFVKVAIAAAAVLTLGFGFTVASVDAQAIDLTDAINLGAESALADEELTLEEMLTYALEDEYLAQAEYQAVIEAYGEVRPFINLVDAEAYHANLLLPLFSTYSVPALTPVSVDDITVADTLTAAIATSIEAEKANIAMYEKFLATDNLPADVETVFEYLLAASNRHLTALSRDRYSCVGRDAAQQVQNMFRWNWNKGNGTNGSGRRQSGECLGN
ncbi:MAG: hypothetical protein V1761_02690 [bacterium]